MHTPGIIQEIGAAIAASPVCGRLAEVSIEVAVLAAAVWGLIRLFRIRSARVCSLLWILVLAKGLLGLAFGAPFELAGLRVAASAGAGQTLAAAGMTQEESALRDEEIRRALSEMESLSTTARAGSQGAAGRQRALSPAQIAASQRDRGASARWEAVLNFFSVRHVAATLVGVWVMGVLWGLLRTALDLRRIRRLCLASDKAPEELLAVFRAEVARLGIARGPQLRVCDQVESPALVGFLKPAVLVPRWLAETSDPARVRWILAHELMHWKLKDTAGLLVRRMAEALLWFHPAVWWAGGRWEEAMERACDRALIAGETDARDYAGQLYQVLEGLVERRSRVRVGAGLFATRTQIGRRIAALLTTPLSAPSRLSPSSLTLLVLLAIAALSFGVGINQAAPEDEKEKASAGKEQTKSAKETIATEAPKPLLDVQEKQSPPGTEPQQLVEIPEPLDRRLLEHIPKRYENGRFMVEALLDLQEKEKRPNALLYYIAAGFVTTDYGTQDDLVRDVLRDGWSEKAASLKPYIEAYQAAFGLVRKGAALDYAKGIGYHGPQTPVPNFLAAQLSAKALSVEGRNFESVGKHREALENYLTVIAMGRDYMSSDNTLISHVVGIALTSIGTGQTRAEVTTGKLAPADLERCRTRLDDIDRDYPSFANAYRMESLCNKWWKDRIRKDGNAEGLIAESKCSPEDAAEMRQVAKDIDRIEADQKRIWDHMLRNLETPWWKRNRPEYEKELERLVNASHPLAAKTIPSFLEADMRWCRARADLRLARLATGLETYKLEHGRYPDSLDALTPAQVGTEPPVDPFTGKLFRYRLDGDRYALWSIGPDSADNAGGTIYDPTNGTMSQGDIILRR